MDKLVREKNRLFVLIFLMMIATDSGIVTINNDRIWARISWIFIMGCFCYFIFKRFNKNIFCFAAFFSITLLFSMIFSEGVFNVNYIQRIILLFTATFIAQKYDYYDFMDSFVKVMRFICVVSLIGVFFHDIICAMNIFPKFYSGEFAYEFLLFTNIPHYSTRNFGPLWEPGAFQIFINLALLYEIRNNSDLNIKDIMLFSLTILSTKSTAGIILLFTILIYFVFLKVYKENKMKFRNAKILLFIIGAVGVIILLSSTTYLDQVFGKITAFFENRNTMNSANVSAYVRFKGIIANIELFFEKPLWGWGIDGITREFDKRYGFGTNTCTILAVASTYGIIPCVMYNYLWIKAVFTEKVRWDGIILGITLALSLSTENLLVSFLFWTILIYESDILKYKSRCKLNKMSGG